VVATQGPVTDSILRGGGPAIALTPVGRRDEFVAAAVAVAGDGAGRAARAAAARRLYERNFDWPVISERLLDSL
jgi:glycosyltransferase involved in cell wall biosynthesis